MLNSSFFSASFNTGAAAYGLAAPPNLALILFYRPTGIPIVVNCDSVTSFRESTVSRKLSSKMSMNFWSYSGFLFMSAATAAIRSYMLIL